jgi:hypothetical protein
MGSSAKWKYLKILGLTALAIIVFFPDVVFELTASFLHFLFESLLELTHLLFEGLESMLDHLIEGLFETDVHSTQIIVFYILLAISIYFLYRLYLVFVRFYRHCLLAWHGFQTEHKLNVIEYWRALTFFGKVKLLLIPSALVYLYVMYFM